MNTLCIEINLSKKDNLTSSANHAETGTKVLYLTEVKDAIYHGHLVQSDQKTMNLDRFFPEDNHGIIVRQRYNRHRINMHHDL
jgi:hypothetical protein